MAITLDPATRVFSVPQADLTFVSGTLYELDTEVAFRQIINQLMDNEDYIWLPDPISHNTEVAVAGVTYARFIEMINSFSVTFTPDSQWSVRLIGSNNNIFDIENSILNQNQVQVIPGNAAGLIVAPGGTALTAQQVEDAVWDATMSDHNTGGSTGKTLRNAGQRTLHDGQAQSAGNGEITLALAALAQDEIYTNSRITILDGTGAGQVRIITSYVGATRSCRISPTWVTEPDNTSDYEITPAIVHAGSGWDTLFECYTIAAASLSITISSRGSPIDDFYTPQQILIHSGLGAGQVRSIEAYDGTTKVVTINRAWDVIPDVTSQYIIQPGAHAPLIAQEVWAYARSGLTDESTMGGHLNIGGKVLRNRTETNPVTGIMTIYDDDDSVLYTVDIWENVAGTTPYGGNSVNRRDRVV